MYDAQSVAPPRCDDFGQTSHLEMNVYASKLTFKNLNVWLYKKGNTSEDVCGRSVSDVNIPLESCQLLTELTVQNTLNV